MPPPSHSACSSIAWGIEQLVLRTANAHPTAYSPAIKTMPWINHGWAGWQSDTSTHESGMSPSSPMIMMGTTTLLTGPFDVLKRRTSGNVAATLALGLGCLSTIAKNSFQRFGARNMREAETVLAHPSVRCRRPSIGEVLHAHGPAWKSHKEKGPGIPGPLLSESSEPVTDDAPTPDFPWSWASGPAWTRPATAGSGSPRRSRRAYPPEYRSAS